MVTEHPKGITVYVRLGSDLKKRLQKVAKEMGIGVSTLIRLWTIERLRAYEEEKKEKKT